MEHRRDWYEMISSQAPNHVDLQFYELEYGGEYCKSVTKYENQFDIIVIDGRDRVHSAKNALTALKADGVILWDNSERNQYQEGFDFLTANGFSRLDFAGLGPINNYGWLTSVFYRSNRNCLQI